MRRSSPELIFITEQKNHRTDSEGHLEAFVEIVGRRSKGEKMALIDYSVLVWTTLTVHAILMVKTDYFGGRMDLFGVRVRRGPHRKPMVGLKLILLD